MDNFGDDFESFLQEENIKDVLDEKNKVILTQEKDIRYLKREIAELKNEINCFRNKKK